ncbi:transglutaminase-like cysteine peptidase [Kistimonas asteriae]|uniref:transglutaminase-like cysteine peptidase n=1 Tax=Kistimonas asteriae TaxID=517724 RepID=UPI001BACAD04|nr:transglutaminase-like cysteine peptidase [Kistimonas asteriae]
MSGTQRTSGQGTQSNLLNTQSESTQSKKPVERKHADEFSRYLGKDQEPPAEPSPSAISKPRSGNQAAKPVPDQVFMVNNMVNNNYQYVRDSRQFNATDYWQTPDEMKQNMAGDCEDFALLKYQILQERGVSEDRLSLAYGKLNGEGHLITLYKDNEGHEHVLDNAASDIRTVEERDDLRVLVRFKMDDVSYGKDGWLKVLEKIRSRAD